MPPGVAAVSPLESLSPLLRSKSEGGLFIYRGTQRAIAPTVDSGDDDALLAGLGGR